MNYKEKRDEMIILKKDRGEWLGGSHGRYLSNASENGLKYGADWSRDYILNSPEVVELVAAADEAREALRGLTTTGDLRLITAILAFKQFKVE